MLLEEFDAEKYERTLREEGREEGRQEGREEGRQEGREEGRREGREEGRQEGREIGDAVRLVDSVRNVMMKSGVSLNEACELIGVTIEQYEAAGKLVEE